MTSSPLEVTNEINISSQLEDTNEIKQDIQKNEVLATRFSPGQTCPVGI